MFAKRTLRSSAWSTSIPFRAQWTSHPQPLAGSTFCWPTTSTLSSSKLRRTRRAKLRHGRELGQQLLSLILPRPVSREVILSLRATRSLQPRQDDISRAALVGAPMLGAANPGPCDADGEDSVGTRPLAHRARTMPFDVFFRVLAEVRRRLPHQQQVPVVLPLNFGMGENSDNNFFPLFFLGDCRAM